ncbi:MAG: NAD(P)H-dependent oxidoreductase subunit E [Candidatus Aminicenantaceae bacterium]
MHNDPSEFEAIIERHSSEKQYLIPILQDIQSQYNYLPPVALATVSKQLDIPMIDIISVASFYNAFSLTPRGDHVVTVCTGTACHVRGGPKILEEFERRLGVPAGGTTEDKQFTLETVACLGCCAIGPVVVVDGEYYAQQTIGKVNPVLKKYASKEKNNGKQSEN